MPTDLIPNKAPKQAGTFNNEPGSSIKFHWIYASSDLLEVVTNIMHRDAHLAILDTDPTQLRYVLKGKRNEQKRKDILIEKAQYHKLFYNFCNLFYVANPFVGLLPGVDYETFVHSARTNLGVNIETAALSLGVKTIVTETRMQTMQTNHGQIARTNDINIISGTKEVKPGTPGADNVSNIHLPYKKEIGNSKQKASRPNTELCCNGESNGTVSQDIENSMMFRTSILNSLKMIETSVDHQGAAGLGMGIQPDIYASFVRQFEETVNRIQKKLNTANPLLLLRPTPPEKKDTIALPPTKATPSGSVTTFSDAINHLIIMHHPKTAIRMGQIVIGNTDRFWLDMSENQAILDNIVKVLIAKNIGKLIEGNIRINRNNVAHAYITLPNISNDIFIESIALRLSAMQGELVQAFVFYPTRYIKHRRNPIGFVTKILNENKKQNDALTFSEALNGLIMRHDSNSPIRMKEKTTKSTDDAYYINWLDIPGNQLLLDQIVEALLSKNMGKLIERNIRINPHNVRQAYITNSAKYSPKDPSKDILIESIILRLCAMHGDIVEAFVFNDTPKTKNCRNPLGFVTKILEKRNDRSVIGHVSLNQNQDYHILKSTAKYIGDLQIEKKNNGANSPNIEINDQMMYMAKVIAWDGETPIGQITHQIGDKNLLETKIKVVLLENQLDVPSFSRSILDALPNETFKIPAEEYANRENLTAEYVFTIDPATARDLDDALSVEQLPNGNFKVGVHISDVSFFVKENSELDDAIQKQATSIYLVDRVYHMLPLSLCMTCSLLPDQDKLSFSVFWEMTESGEIISTRFARTVINSCVQLADSHAQRMIDNPKSSIEPDGLLPLFRKGFEASIIADKVRLLHRLATPLRQKRFDRFCLSINQPEISFKLDPETGKPLSIEQNNHVESSRMIEEFMLLANQSVASFIHTHLPKKAVLVKNDTPHVSNIGNLQDKLHQYGFKIDPNNISETLYGLLNQPNIAHAKQSVLSDLVMRVINRAEYICSDGDKPMSHFALSIPIYTHFTSPIRRYADIMVHRQLAASLKLSNYPCRELKDLQTIVDRCTLHKYNAQMAEKSSTRLYFNQFIEMRGKWEMRAVVTDMVNAGMFVVMLLETGMKFTININKNKPALKFKISREIPLSGYLNFGSRDKRAILCEVFTEVLVELSINSANEVHANLLAPKLK